MATKTLTGWTNKFLQKLNTLTSQDKIDARALIDAASHTDTAAALANKQPLDADLTAYAEAGDTTPGITAEQRKELRRNLIGAASNTSPNLSAPTCNTAPDGSNSALIANTAFVQGAVGALSGDGAPDFAFITIAGVVPTTGVGSAVVPLSPVSLNGKLAWQGDNWYVQYTGTEWLVLAENPSTNNDTYRATIADPADLPVGLTGWNVTVGLNEPVLSLSTTPASYIGQLYRDTVNNKWYIWNGTLWEELTITAP